MSAGIGATAAGRWVYRLLVTSVLVGVGMLFGSTVAVAGDIAPEEYPPPPVEEEVAGPPEKPELVPTGVDSAWPWVTAGGAGLVLAGGALVVLRRRLTHD